MSKNRKSRKKNPVKPTSLPKSVKSGTDKKAVKGPVPTLALNYDEVVSTLNLLEGAPIKGINSVHLFAALTGKMLGFVKAVDSAQGGKDGSG